MVHVCVCILKVFGHSGSPLWDGCVLRSLSRPPMLSQQQRPYSPGRAWSLHADHCPWPSVQSRDASSHGLGFGIGEWLEHRVRAMTSRPSRLRAGSPRDSIFGLPFLPQEHIRSSGGRHQKVHCRSAPRSRRGADMVVQPQSPAHHVSRWPVGRSLSP